MHPTSIDSHGQIQNIVMFLYRSEGLAKHVDSFMQMLSLLELKEETPFIFAPWFSDDLHKADSLRSYLSLACLLSLAITMQLVRCLQ